MTDSDALILAGLLAFGLAALSAILWGACVYWRGELRDYKAACWRLVAEADAREKMIRRLQQERDGLVLQLDRLVARVGELREGAVILGQLASDQLDRMRAEADKTRGEVLGQTGAVSAGKARDAEGAGR
jgi:hypothetical protein